MFYAQLEGRIANLVIRNKGALEWLSFGLAHNWDYKNERIVEWIQCTIWGEQGRRLKDQTIIQHGSMVHATGAVTTNEWRTTNGEYRKDVCLRVDELTPMHFDESTGRYFRDTEAKVDTRSFKGKADP